MLTEPKAFEIPGRSDRTTASGKTNEVKAHGRAGDSSAAFLPLRHRIPVPSLRTTLPPAPHSEHELQYEEAEQGDRHLA